MKGLLLGNHFDNVVYGLQTAFIKSYPLSAKKLSPHYNVGEEYYIKEEWKVIQILDYKLRPEMNGHKAILYSNDLNPALTAGFLFNGINSYLYNHHLLPDDSVPGLVMKSSPLNFDASMPSWAARYSLKITSATFPHIQQLTIDDLISVTGDATITFETFRIFWDAGRRPHYDTDPIVGIYNFEITELNGYHSVPDR